MSSHRAMSHSENLIASPSQSLPQPWLRPSDYSYDWSSDWGLESCGNCAEDWKGDGECDRLCNKAACGWDGGDCFHGNNGCYTSRTGSDYRGTMNKTVSGLPCQYWSDQWPNTHTYTTAAWPDGGLGGHNFCRNPDPSDGSTGPWCLTASLDATWEYCDVDGPADVCAGAKPLPNHAIVPLTLDHWSENFVYERSYQYFKVDLPASVKGVQVVLLPLAGDPDMYLSFDNTFPTGHSYDYVQDAIAVDTFTMSRDMHGFCGVVGQEADCALYLSVTAYESSNYRLVVFDTTQPGKEQESLCSPGCDWKFLGDGDCQLPCNTTACLYDRTDCTRNDATQCKVDCKPEWIGDGYCDDACYNAQCSWDGTDCGGAGCAGGCFPKYLGDGACDAACNNHECNFDLNDCFHGHSECYSDPKGMDYRGTVSHTKSGHVCQAWSDQFPKVHTRTAKNYPGGGLGGHNFCRNPDGAEAPWCYPIDSETRWELCDVGEPSSDACPSPPPPPPKLAPRPPPPPPSPPPHPPRHPHPSPAPPPDPCPTACPAEPDGKCDVACNTTVCLWDKGDCMDIVHELLKEAGLAKWIGAKPPPKPPPPPSPPPHPPRHPHPSPPPPPKPPRSEAVLEERMKAIDAKVVFLVGILLALVTSLVVAYCYHCQPRHEKLLQSPLEIKIQKRVVAAPAVEAGCKPEVAAC